MYHIFIYVYVCFLKELNDLILVNNDVWNFEKISTGRHVKNDNNVPLMVDSSYSRSWRIIKGICDPRA